MNEQLLTTMTWLIPAMPILAFFLIALFVHRNRTLSWMLAWVAIISSLIMSWTVAINVLGRGLHALEEHPVQVAGALDWLPLGDFFEGQWFRMGVNVDPLGAIMLMMVSLATTMIFIYSVGYHNWGHGLGKHKGEPQHDMTEEPLLARFFGYMCLFGGSMLLLVVADNLLLLFFGWELMGFCSYSLIGFWYARNYPEQQEIKRIPPRQAAIKAFMTTRVADVVMLLGIVFMWVAFGTLNFSEAFTVEGFEHVLGVVGAGGLGLMTLLLFTGTVGKSAQWPLHVWLPDAMEGPTPVSAIIHAAAMVSAGIFMLLRIFPLIAVSIEGTPWVGLVIAGIGAFTAIMAATIAVAQYDVKAVLAYSTISQLGFMVAAIGLGAYVAAAFHLITHAFFKALLFLASGSVIHGMEHGAVHVHDHHHDPQDMRNMGGLRQKMPITFWTFLIGGLALSGFPFVTAGFWSKDEIFADAWYQWSHDQKVLALVVFVTLATAALLTAFYTMRQISMTFLGKPRTALADHAHESSGFMTVPLMVLSVFAVGAGWFGISDHFLGTDGIFTNFFHHYVGAQYFHLMEELHELGLVGHAIETLPWSWVPLIVSLVVALGGLALGWLVYARRPLSAGQPDPLVKTLGPIHPFLNNKWGWDGLYNSLFIQPTVRLSEKVIYEFIDKGIIDGTLHLIARTVYAIGGYLKRFEEVVVSGGVDWVKDRFLSMAKEFRYLQTGKVQEYALISVFIATALAVVILLISSGWLDYIF
ncbi:NADH-quinone oxidoreductase chain L [Candidatus Promineifilum breve]|uniref:NADH-quinone oxidoreductase chain L n=1 Tax=Candidatus Promineifilum breve TaxID=1806508 RepID=A0A160T454_9CHLR|nr:NADH-quinone oxidoreductase subunit L [Candidatus Promineifilum breve]CUS04572.2 NADH-quinone oxidoreductase chain L [Candidatus Promineifilum breve]